ncbi:hypothetical protein T11_11026 [Trichinella zimbabwensis]|uniref:Uncharacterized protein n=1 Tax=Trichinella zimbabwensis TaxID=268475 RepID=A0A0V1HWT8_9BILA|nr:hypothetical protein T11_11026 [Trichinella zimbabwensis]
MGSIECFIEVVVMLIINCLVRCAITDVFCFKPARITLYKQLVHRIGQKYNKSNYLRLQRRMFVKKLHKIGFPVSLEDWTMHPNKINCKEYMSEMFIFSEQPSPMEIKERTTKHFKNELNLQKEITGYFLASMFTVNKF